MAKMKITGSFVALITPFNADGAVDFGAFAELLAFHEPAWNERGSSHGLDR